MGEQKRPGGYSIRSLSLEILPASASNLPCSAIDDFEQLTFYFYPECLAAEARALQA